MIFFISDGRLGNQMFQYAYLNTIARDGERIVCTNMAQFNEHIEYKNKNFTYLKTSRFNNFLFNRITPLLLDFLVKVQAINYMEQLRSNTSSLPEISRKNGFFPFTYVKTGFFQTEKLLNPNRVDIKLKEKSVDKAKSIIKSLPEANEKVFIHIRRGDYLNESFLGKRGIDLPKSYFNQAIALIEKKVKSPFYIFLTDDPGYVECCFKEIKNKYISTECLATDLSLMSLCRYGITSNSSFSWWGAYLMKNKKIVTFPNYWYGWKHKIQSHIDIQPSWGTTIDPVESNNS